jgi:polyisoprenoid-binding protein YceI
MKSLYVAFLTFFIALNAVAGGVEPISKNINVSTSSVSWKGYKVTGSHEGNLKFKSGSLKFDNDVLVGGELLVDMNSINCTDLEGKAKGNLEGHLKSDDFFGVQNHPTSSIKFTKVVSRGIPGEYKVTANIMIKNVTKEIKFNANLKNGQGTAEIKLDRSDFDVRYGSGSFFDNLGDKTIFDEFDLNVTLNY